MKQRADTNLITTWLTCEIQMKPFRTLTDVVSELNKALRRHYKLSRVREWERGIRAPDPVAHNYILSRALPYALDKATARGNPLSKPAVERLRRALSLPITLSGT